MSQNYSKLSQKPIEGSVESRDRTNWWMILVIPAWVVISFFGAQIVVIGLSWGFKLSGVSLISLNPSILNTLLASLIYLITLAFVILLPLRIKKIKTSRKEIGLTRLPRWGDILLAPAGLVAYLIVSSLLILLATKVLPGFNIDQVQDTGFSQVSQRYEYVLAFATLVVVAPIAEEILFRGYLFGKLKKYVPVWVAVIITSVLFGTVHGSWNVAIDTFALSIMLCLLREFTGSIWSSILLHMIKNGIAFYILFIYPTLLTTLVK